jgi:hypothetical protein
MTNFDENNYDPLARRLVEKLHQVPERDEAAAARGRQRFLSQARLLAGETHSAGLIPQLAVSRSPIQRLKGWIRNTFRSNQLDRRKPMATFLTSMLLVIAILFGGTGATVYAAQDSQPDGLLYPLKTLSEDVRLSLRSDPHTKLDLVLDFVNRRVDEMAGMKMRGHEIPVEVYDRYQNHLRLAYQLAAGLDDDDLEEAAEKIYGVHLRTQDRLNWDLDEFPGAGYGDPVLSRVEAAVRNQMRVLENDEELPFELQFSLRQRMRMMSEDDNDLSEPPYQYQHEEGEPVQSGDDPNQGDSTQQQGLGSQQGPGYGSDDPGSGNGSDGGGQDDKDPGTGNDHQSSPDPQKSGKSD